MPWYLYFLRHPPPTKLMRDLCLATAQACVAVIGQTVARSLTLPRRDNGRQKAIDLARKWWSQDPE